MQQSHGLTRCWGLAVTSNEARKAIYQAFKDSWNPSDPSVPYAFENEALAESDEWVRVLIRSIDGGQITLGPVGSRVYRRRGAVVVEVASAVDRGLLRLEELTTAARDIFEGKTIDGVAFNDGNILDRPPNGRWAMADVVVAFTYDETK